MEHSRTDDWPDRPSVLTGSLMLVLAAMSVVPALVLFVSGRARHWLGRRGPRQTADG